MRVTITDLAKADLSEIGDFILEDNPLRAESFVYELLDRCRGLAEYPQRYPVIGTWHGRQLRRCAFGRYLIFYSVLEDEVEINHVVHSARDYMRVLFSED
ncbi:MAG TPA: type II toxin-antitoxin system RelE/ParE family toxin [Devosia sp.]|jgi:plasmid stabilization system protein ParE|nr:type II toxin-antitoxin system RelE/ParE family toxin [Devosia sp.]